MTAYRIDPSTGNLVAGTTAVFPIGLSDPPPVDAWGEIERAGVNFVRNYTVWRPAAAAEQLIEVGQALDAARSHGLQVWLALAGIDETLAHAPLLEQIVAAVKSHPGLGAWKGADEPAHGRLPAAALVSVYERIKAIDPDHPVVLIEAPRAANGRLTQATVRPYAAACDVHGVDIYPIPPGAHAGGPPVNTDLSVVGDVTRIVAAATRRKAIWTTLQIAWSGVLPPHRRVFPTLQQARFMAYDAIVAGARGLFFFGGQLKGAMNAKDRARGWNWTYWSTVQRPLVEELSGPGHVRALVAPAAPFAVVADAHDVALSTRQDADAVYVIAVRRSARAGTRVRFHGLPATIAGGTVLAHGPSNPPRDLDVHGGAFTDPSPFRGHNARVYRFPRR